MMHKNSLRILILGIFLTMPTVMYPTLEFSSQSSKLVVDQPHGAFIMRSGSLSRDQLEGDLVITQYQNVQGQPLFINNGIISDGNFDLVLTGSYDPNFTYSIVLYDGGSLNAQNSRNCPLRVFVNGTSVQFQGFTNFSASNALRLSKASTTLTMATKEKLGTSIILSGGTLNLADSLTCADNVLITGSGAITFNQNNLSTGNTSLVWTDTLRFIDAENLILFSDNKLYGQWIFQGDGAVFGNNNVLDLTSGASIWIKHNTTIEMSDLIINGLKSGQIVLEDQTSHLRLFNVTLSLDGNCTMTIGGLYFEGSNRIVTDDHFFTITERATMTVDAGTVLYDPLDTVDNNNVRFGATGFESVPKFITYIRGGSVRKVDSLTVGPHKITQNKKLDREFIISSLRPMIVAADPVIDGDGFAYQFARNPGQAIVTVDAGMMVQYKNILLKDFPISSPALSVGVGAQLFFGPDATIELGENGELDETLYFTGNSVLNGKGKILQLGTNGKLVLRPGATVLFDDVTIKGFGGHKLICMDNNCTVSLGDMTIKLSSDYTFTQGQIDILGQSELVGTATFGYQSTKRCLITSFGMLSLHDNLTFSYAPITANRDLIVMQDSAATLHLDSATLISTTTGMRLTTGTLIIDGHAIFQNPAGHAKSENITFGDGTPANDLTITVNPGAILDVVSGGLSYENEE